MDLLADRKARRTYATGDADNLRRQAINEHRSAFGATSFDHLVGADEQHRRHGQADSARRFEVDDQIELRRRLHR